MTEFPEIERLRGQGGARGVVTVADAELAVRDARTRAFRDCVDALRAEQERERYAFDDGWDAAAHHLERTMLDGSDD
jgi:hypothetical protein